jgi:hypothetical protein
MEKLFAALMVASIFVLIPAIGSGLLRAANIRLWLIPLRRRIGSVPKEVFLPKAVKFGLIPLGYIAIIVFVVGVVCILVGGEAHILSDTPTLTKVGRLLAIIPFIFFGLFLLDWVWWRSGHFNPEGQIAKGERERQERKASIQTLSQWIEEKRDASGSRLGYFHLWRACHLIESVQECISGNIPVDESVVTLITTDIQAILTSPETDTKLLEETQKKQRYIDDLPPLNVPPLR